MPKSREKTNRWHRRVKAKGGRRQKKDIIITRQAVASMGAERAIFKLAGKTPIEIQAIMIAEKMIPDVRVGKQVE